MCKENVKDGDDGQYGDGTPEPKKQKPTVQEGGSQGNAAENHDVEMVDVQGQPVVQSDNLVLRIHHLDVGQGDCTLIVLKEGRNKIFKDHNGNHANPRKNYPKIKKALLIDGGEGVFERIKVYLNKVKNVSSPNKFPKNFDAVICSHYDSDHMKGLTKLFNSLDICDKNTIIYDPIRDPISENQSGSEKLYPGYIEAINTRRKAIFKQLLDKHNNSITNAVSITFDKLCTNIKVQDIINFFTSEDTTKNIKKIDIIVKICIDSPDAETFKSRIDMLSHFFDDGENNKITAILAEKKDDKSYYEYIFDKTNEIKMKQIKEEYNSWDESSTKFIVSLRGIMPRFSEYFREKENDTYKYDHYLVGAEIVRYENFVMQCIAEDYYIKSNKSEPEKTEKPNKENEQKNDISLSFLVKFNQYSYLTSGDIGSEQEKKIGEFLSTTKVNAFKISHHGSNSATNAQYIEDIADSNSVAIISYGFGNRHGHINQEPFYNLISSNKVSKIYCTGLIDRVLSSKKKSQITECWGNIVLDVSEDNSMTDTISNIVYYDICTEINLNLNMFIKILPDLIPSCKASTPFMSTKSSGAKDPLLKKADQIYNSLKTLNILSDKGEFKKFHFKKEVISINRDQYIKNVIFISIYKNVSYTVLNGTTKYETLDTIVNGLFQPTLDAFKKNNSPNLNDFTCLLADLNKILCEKNDEFFKKAKDSFIENVATSIIKRLKGINFNNPDSTDIQGYYYVKIQDTQLLKKIEHTGEDKYPLMVSLELKYEEIEALKNNHIIDSDGYPFLSIFYYLRDKTLIDFFHKEIGKYDYFTFIDEIALINYLTSVSLAAIEIMKQRKSTYSVKGKIWKARDIWQVSRDYNPKSP